MVTTSVVVAVLVTLRDDVLQLILRTMSALFSFFPPANAAIHLHCAWVYPLGSGIVPWLLMVPVSTAICGFVASTQPFVAASCAAIGSANRALPWLSLRTSLFAVSALVAP